MPSPRKKVQPKEVKQFDIFDEITNLPEDQLEQIQAHVNKLREERTKQFNSRFIFFETANHRYRFDTNLKLLHLQHRGTYIDSPYQFLINAALRDREYGPYLVRNIIDHMIQILISIREKMNS